MCEEIVSGLASFVGDSPTAFHAVANIGDILQKNGYQRLYEKGGRLARAGSIM